MKVKYNINFNNYKVFYEVAKEKSFTKAAKCLYMTQPAISSIIKNLETELGTKLFIRSYVGVTLTTSGTILFKSLSRAFKNIEKAELIIANEGLNAINSLVIGSTRMIGDFFLSEWINKFIQENPEIKVKILIDNSEVLFNKLEKGKIDLIFDIDQTFASNYSIEKHVISEMQSCFVCNKKIYENLKGKKISIDDLFKYKVILSKLNKSFFETLAKKNKICFEPLFEMPDSKLMIDMILNNDCIGYVLEDLFSKEKNLFRLEISMPLEKKKIVILYLKENNNPNIKLFQKFLDIDFSYIPN